MQPAKAAVALSSYEEDGFEIDTDEDDGLKRSAQRDPRGAVKQAAQQFEALFMQMVLKSMRDATPKSGLLDSPAGDTYTGMLDQQMATRMSSSGTGLADVIVRQLTRHMDRGADKGAAAGSAADPAGAAPAAVSAAPAGGARARALAAYDSAARTAPLSSADPVRESPGFGLPARIILSLEIRDRRARDPPLA
jgi:flagellar protein FlgJ